jgi:predicted ATP-dependent endonuclease of OLD family
MRLEKVILKNFRSYKNETEIPITDSITTFIGKNDAGKSSVFEALDIFFENSKIEPEDACVYGDDNNVYITCVFYVGDESIIIDDESETTLKDEYLLSNDGNLHITKYYNCNTQKPKCIVYATAQHPVFTGSESLLYLKNAELKKIIDDNGINDDIDRRSNVSLRKAIRDNLEHKIREIRIQLDKEDAKKIWSKIQQYLPVYALFRADRPSQDGDEEVINPLKIAVKQAVKDKKDKFDEISNHIKKYVEKIAENTLTELKEMVPALAEELKPDLSKEPAWHTLFKYTFSTDNNIPLNKRGSGVRRMIILNFFRAEAKRMLKESNKNTIIYAFEEPETSQHPNNQKLLIDAFNDISLSDNTQILVSTHVPAIAQEMRVDTIRFLSKGNETTICDSVTDESELSLKQIASDLGIWPDSRIRLLIFVEGVNDVEFLKNISFIISKNDSRYPDLNALENDKKIAFIPLGGSQLLHWVNKNYLEGLNLAELHIYDSDKPEYAEKAEVINNRDDTSKAYLTYGNTMENYIHQDAVVSFYADNGINLAVEYNRNDDVPFIVASELHRANSKIAWADVSEENKRKKLSQVKKVLNTKVSKQLTYEQICECDPDSTIEEWLRKIKELVELD